MGHDHAHDHEQRRPGRRRVRRLPRADRLLPRQRARRRRLRRRARPPRHVQPVPGQVRPAAHREVGRRPLVRRGGPGRPARAGADAHPRGPGADPDHRGLSRVAPTARPRTNRTPGRWPGASSSSARLRLLGRLPWLAAFFGARGACVRSCPWCPPGIEIEPTVSQVGGPGRESAATSEPARRNRSASTTTRVTSPVPTTLPAPPASTWRAATVKRCSRPSTYAEEARDLDLLARRRWRRGARARPGCRRWSSPAGSVGSSAAQVAASHQASRRGVPSTGQGARARAAAAVSSSVTVKRRVASSGHEAPGRRRSGRRPGRGDQSRSGTRTKPSRS